MMIVMEKNINEKDADHTLFLYLFSATIADAETTLLVSD